MTWTGCASRVRTSCRGPRTTSTTWSRLIATLLERGHAYRTDDGSIFFRIASWPAYGTLARLEPDAQRVGERVEADEYSKDDVRDFALWKGPKPGEPSLVDRHRARGVPAGTSSAPRCRMRYLGASFDIHTGGIDLVFPHHEDEIAQSEAATGQPFVRTWLHCAHLQMGGEKMAKRTGNIARPARPLCRRARVLARCATPCWRPTTAPAWTSARRRWRRPTAAVERLSTVVAALEAYREERPDDASLPALLETHPGDLHGCPGRRSQRLARTGRDLRPGA